MSLFACALRYNHRTNKPITMPLTVTGAFHSYAGTYYMRKVVGT